MCSRRRRLAGRRSWRCRLYYALMSAFVVFHDGGKVLRLLTVGDVGDESIKHKHPCQRVRERLLELIELPMLIPNTLPILSDPFNRKHPVFFTQPPRVELVIRHHEPENNTHGHRQQPRQQKHNLPSLQCGRMLSGPLCDPIRHQTTEYLGPPVKTEPNAHARSLFGFCVPLRGDEREAGCHCRLADAEEEAHGDGTAEVVHGGEAGEGGAPEDDTDGGEFAKRKALEGPVGEVFKAEVAKVEHAA